jgi:PEP-CTERM motif
LCFSPFLKVIIMRKILLLSLSLFASAANADVIVATGGSGTGNNVIYNASCASTIVGPATTVQGCLNGQPTEFVSLIGTENLILPSGGQARVEASDGGFTTLSIEFTDPSAYFNEIILNLNNPSADGNVTFSVNPGLTFGTSATWAISDNGQNFFTITTTGGDLIRQLTLTTDVALTNVRQIRFGEVVRVASVPEPASFALLGLGLAGLGAARRRRS